MQSLMIVFAVDAELLRELLGRQVIRHRSASLGATKKPADAIARGRARSALVVGGGGQRARLPKTPCALEDTPPRGRSAIACRRRGIVFLSATDARRAERLTRGSRSRRSATRARSARRDGPRAPAPRSARSRGGRPRSGGCRARGRRPQARLLRLAGEEGVVALVRRLDRSWPAAPVDTARRCDLVPGRPGRRAAGGRPPRATRAARLVERRRLDRARRRRRSPKVPTGIAPIRAASCALLPSVGCASSARW